MGNSRKRKSRWLRGQFFPPGASTVEQPGQKPMTVFRDHVGAIREVCGNAPEGRQVGVVSKNKSMLPTARGEVAPQVGPDFENPRRKGPSLELRVYGQQDDVDLNLVSGGRIEEGFEEVKL